MKTSPKRSYSVIENERFGLVLAKTVSIISGTAVVQLPPGMASKFNCAKTKMETLNEVLTSREGWAGFPETCILEPWSVWWCGKCERLFAQNRLGMPRSKSWQQIRQGLTLPEMGKSARSTPYKRAIACMLQHKRSVEALSILPVGWSKINDKTTHALQYLIFLLDGGRNLPWTKRTN